MSLPWWALSTELWKPCATHKPPVSGVVRCGVCGWIYGPAPYVPLSVRHGNRRKRFGWWLKGRREALAFWFAPWLRGAVRGPEGSCAPEAIKKEGRDE